MLRHGRMIICLALCLMLFSACGGSGGSGGSSTPDESLTNMTVDAVLITGTVSEPVTATLNTQADEDASPDAFAFTFEDPVPNDYMLVVEDMSSNTETIYLEVSVSDP